ncbi:type II secretion system protein [Sulfuriferula sp.]|uniref:type II secretion system protein n=1 Tax=Sulfuriferula sp. TaxID=2025307 RepID=UPI0035228459
MKPRIYRTGHLNLTRGFTLIEMAIVLIIITLVVGGALVPLGAQIEQRQRAETQKTLDEIKEALIGYAVSQGKLPCPSAVVPTIPNGVATASCSGIATGYIPWDTLGVNNKDAWGNLIHYAVDAQFTTTAFGLGTTGSITIKTRNADGSTPSISSNIPVVVLSLGKNGYGAMSADGINLSTPATFATNNPDEYQNQNVNSNTFYSRTPAPQGTATTLGGEFDDMVVWISPNILFNRMVAASVLPRN